MLKCRTAFDEGARFGAAGLQVDRPRCPERQMEIPGFAGAREGHSRKGMRPAGSVPNNHDGLIDLRALFQQTFDRLAYEDMPSLLKPKKGKLVLQDHEKVFCVDHKGEGDIFDMRGIDREKGCMIVVRPDQYIAHVLPLDAFAELAAFFDGFLLPASRE